mmetsp:Transcript_21599/g.45601  ORF Transcript_21599/g.45601 Transcript_21599/m.45601 type:complete len:152 (+) Transcript_21599:586-1041(+)
MQEGLITCCRVHELARRALEFGGPQGAPSHHQRQRRTDVQERTAEAMAEFAKYRARDGIFTKQFVLSNIVTMAPASWWATYGKHLPTIASVAQRVLSQPVSASAAERNWSIYGQIKFDDRNRLGHEVTDKLVYCHETIHLREKLQKAGYIN